MSIIVPAGNNKVKWSPSNDSLKKTASTDINTSEVQEESNPLYEAAKSYIEAGSVPGVCDGTGPSWANEEDKVEEVLVEDKVEEVSTEDKVEEVSTEGKVEEAVEKIEEAVEDIKEVVGEDKKDDEEVKEIEIELEEVSDTPEESKEVDNTDIIVESEPTCAETDSDINKEASVEEEFCKFAKLSPANKKKLADYWVNALGFPKDYVALMTKDYEK